MELQVGVKVIIQNSKGELLLLNRSYSELLPSGASAQWDIPGGRINPGEPIMEALAREIQEEIGAELVGKPALLTAQDIFIESRNWHVVRLTHIHQQDIEDITLSDEHKGHQWVSVQEAKQLEMEPFLKEVIQTLTV